MKFIILIGVLIIFSSSIIAGQEVNESLPDGFPEENESLPEENETALDLCVDNDGDGFDNCDVGEVGDDGNLLDCDDNSDLLNPDQPELLDLEDNDCDGVSDEGFLLNSQIFPYTYSCSGTCSLSCSGEMCEATGVVMLLVDEAVEFEWDSDETSLDFSDINIEKSSIGNSAAILLRGFDGSKTVYLERLNDFNAVCVKDSEVSSFEISEMCDAGDEVLLVCDGSSEQGLSCSLGSENYRVSGLDHSLVVEFDSSMLNISDGEGIMSSENVSNSSSGNVSGQTNSSNETTSSTPTQSSGSSSSGSSSSSSSRSRNVESQPNVTYKKIIGASCETSWVCSAWGSCSEGYQTRNCTKILPECEVLTEKPDERKMCFDIDFPRLNDESIEDSNQSGFDEPLLDSGSKFNRTVGIIVLGFIAAFVLFVVVKTVTLLVRKRNRRELQ